MKIKKFSLFTNNNKNSVTLYYLKEKLNNIKDTNDFFYKDDFANGFKVLTQPSIFLTWETTYQQLLEKSLGSIKNNKHGSFYHFDYPVLIGFLKIQGLQIDWNNIELDKPIQNYFINNINSDKFYQTIADIEFYLNCHASVLYQCKSSNTKEIYKCDEIYLELLKDNYYKNFKLSIINRRDYQYRNFLQQYEDKAVLSDFRETYIFFDENYRQNKYISKKSKKIASFCHAKSMVFVDEVNKVVGFVGKTENIIIPKNMISDIEGSYARPARGYGWIFSYLNLIDANKIAVYFGGDNFKEFEHKIQQVAKFLNYPCRVTDFGYDY